MIELVPLGDRAWLARLADPTTANAWAGAVRLLGVPGLIDVVGAYSTVAVHFDPDRIEPAHVRKLMEAVRTVALDAPRGRLFEIPTLYDGEDLQFVASSSGLDPDEVVSIHSGATYDVLAVGFLPGFPYAGDLPDALRGLRRRDSPRARVPAGSVAIVGRQTAIYPSASPGGWHMIGRTPLVIADLESGFLPIRAGDRLRFESIERGQFDDLAGEQVVGREITIPLDPGDRA